MTLVFLTHRYCPATGGIENYVHGLVEALSSRHTIKVVSLACGRTEQITEPGTTDPESRVSSPVVNGQWSVVSSRWSVVRLGLSRWDRVRLLPLSVRRWPYLGGRFHQPLQAWTHPFFAGVYARKLREELAGAELIHFFGGQDFAAVTQRVVQKQGVPFVITPFTHIGWWGDDPFNLRVYRAADAVTALSQAERDFYVKQGVRAERVHVLGAWPVVQGGADGKGFRREHGITGPMVLFLGRKERYKGYRELLAAAPEVWAACPDATFVFIGPPTAESKQDFAAGHDLRIRELGRVSEDEKASALAACDVFCLPSVSESFGLAFLEAWHFGKPVVACSIPPCRELIEDGVDGILVPPSREGLGAALLELLRDSGKRGRTGEAGKRKVHEQYSLAKTVERTQRVYDHVLSPNRELHRAL